MTLVSGRDRVGEGPDSINLISLEVPSEEPAPEGEGAQQEAAPAFVSKSCDVLE